ncbi:hypothetical protein NQ314_017186 [Rhamnusium bicolor]|uniref:PiggyBac transposable element-derived protein domain-containing protein n=1 Tax=Rhamnusium bicolor TaxID=1586634 RepID=A0AAV8WUM7_9CUCU|nr:hypothetical protein NQ314_017186 [Rhamnusium bicolor]
MSYEHEQNQLLKLWQELEEQEAHLLGPKRLAKNKLKIIQFLLVCLRFDCKQTRAERRRIDKLAPIKSIFDRFVDHCKECYTPAEYMTIDEKLEAFRKRCRFRQYIPNKPVKYGIQVFMLVDARTFYAFNLEVYVGKLLEERFWLSNKPDIIVLRLVEPIGDFNRTITFDKWFAIYPLLLKPLNEYKLIAVSTLRKTKCKIPPSVLKILGRENVSYIPKKGIHVLFSALHKDDKIYPETTRYIRN